MTPAVALRALLTGQEFTMHKSILSVAAILGLAVASTTALAGGSLKGKFIFDGKAPAPAKLKVDKDVPVCAPGGKAPADESLVVDPDTGGIANIIVSLYVKPGGKKPAKPEGYKDLLKKPAELDNTKCRFEPRVTVVYAGQELVLKNTDTVGHNVKANLLKNAPFNDLIPGGGKLSKKSLTQEETLPAEASCSIHPWMRGYLVVRDDPYVAVSGTDGAFEIKDLPAGDWTFRAWQERSGYIEEVKIDGKADKWEKGRFEIKDGSKDHDLGEIKIGIKEFPDK
jgi:plastocyanin